MSETDFIGIEASGKSVDSISSLDTTAEQGRFTEPVDSSKKSCLSQERFTDSVSALIVCREHRKLALSVLHSHPSQDLWFPIYPLKSDQCYDEVICHLMSLVLCPEKSSSPTGSLTRPQTKAVPQSFTDPQLVHTLRLQVPKCLEFVTRVLFYTELLPPTSGQCVCLMESSLVGWYAFQEVLALPNLHGPEPLIGASFLSQTGSSAGFPESCLRSYEISMRKLSQATSVGVGVHWELFQKAGFTSEDLQLLYSDYVQHCFPSPYMNQHSFADYISRARPRLELSSHDPSNLFRAFDSAHNLYYIDFFDFATGLAVLDKATPHASNCAKLRGEYIFRYYNQSQSILTLRYEDVCLLAHDQMLLSNGHEPEQDPLDQLVQKMYDYFSVSLRAPVSKVAFASAIQHTEFPDLSSVLRVGLSIGEIKSQPQYPVLKRKANSNSSCSKCREKKFTLAAHHITVQVDGSVVDPTLIHHVADVSRMPKAARQKSDQIFSSTLLYNRLMDQVRDFFEKGNSAEWSKLQHRIETVPLIKQVCNEAKKLLSAEARVVKVSSPCFIFGDIHGNLHDLLSYERIFWRMGPACLSDNFLFLGDYVDRGEHSVECALYLLCAKLLCPARFYLIRGNHEVRQIQRQFTFYAECLRKFDNQGIDVWQAFNSAFDCLPIAAVIDEQIYCAHGGIPTSVNKLEQLASIPCPLESPMLESAAAWEVLWNDPVTNQEHDSIISELRKQRNSFLSRFPAGFLPNTKRATAFYFGEEATNTFLATNGLSHVIRAHEVVPPGFNFHCGGRVITVFSCSRYCGQDNQAACILVGLDSKIRVIKVDTYEKE